MHTTHSFTQKITSVGLAAYLLMSLPTTALAANTIDFDITDEAKNQDLPTSDIPGLSASSNPFKQAFADLIGSILSIVISIAFIMLLIYLIWGGFAWITSSGDKGKLDEARNRMSTAIIGIIVLSSVVALFMLVQQMLGICVLDFWGTACVAPPAP